VILGGLSGAVEKRHYAAVAEFHVYGGQTYDQELSVPVTFAAYRITVQGIENQPESPSAERAFARMVIDAIPRDVWDAGVAAVMAGDKHGLRTAQEIVDRWRRGEYEGEGKGKDEGKDKDGLRG